jgi:NADPH:quinone reductase-like Zn-dependent oxidoreductase
MLIDRIDGKPQLVIRDVEKRLPAAGEVRYVVHAIGLNRADLLYMRGEHYTETVFPSRIGYEACGVIDAVGDGVTAFAVGDRVSAIPFGDPEYGTGGEFALTPVAFLAPWPNSLSALEATASWMQYTTAYFPLVELAKVGPDDVVLITAASSSAALGAIQIAKILGARVVASTRTREKVGFLLASGADHVVIADEGNVSAQIIAAVGRQGVRVVYDAVSGSFVKEYAGALARNAQVFVYGSLGGSFIVECPMGEYLRAGASVHFYSLMNVLRDFRDADRAKSFILPAMRERGLRPIIDSVFRFEDAALAYSHLESGKQKGKIVLRTIFADV